jgi:hypothetical protein
MMSCHLLLLSQYIRDETGQSQLFPVEKLLFTIYPVVMPSTSVFQRHPVISYVQCSTLFHVF